MISSIYQLIKKISAILVMLLLTLKNLKQLKHSIKNFINNLGKDLTRKKYVILYMLEFKVLKMLTNIFPKPVL